MNQKLILCQIQRGYLMTNPQIRKAVYEHIKAQGENGLEGQSILNEFPIFAKPEMPFIHEVTDFLIRKGLIEEIPVAAGEWKRFKASHLSGEWFNG